LESQKHFSTSDSIHTTNNNIGSVIEAGNKLAF